MKFVWAALIIALLGILVALEAVLVGTGDGFVWQVPGFFALFGIVGFLVLVVISKGLGRWIRRYEDYYDRNGDE